MEGMTGDETIRPPAPRGRGGGAPQHGCAGGYTGYAGGHTGGMAQQAARQQQPRQVAQPLPGGFADARQPLRPTGPMHPLLEPLRRQKQAPWLRVPRMVLLWALRAERYLQAVEIVS